MTIEKIARELGVSKSTVSRALSGKGRIGEETRKKIQAYAEEYEKNSSKNIRRDMKKGLVKTENIGVVIPYDVYTASIPFFHECLLGICAAAATERYHVLITTGNGYEYSGIQDMIENKKVDGVILMRSLEGDQLLKYLVDKKIPTGLTGGCDYKEVIQADMDNMEASSRLTSLLADSGYRRFALVTGDLSYRVNQQRVQGFYQGIEKNGLSREEQLYVPNFAWSGLLDNIINDVLACKTECIVCGDDVICTRLMSRLLAEGYRIPLDIAIASLYNSISLDCFSPAVTAVNTSARQLGSAVGKQLLNCLKGREYKEKTVIDYEILFRKSAGKRHR